MSTILITGGTGFVGQHLARRLVKSGHAVRLAVRASLPDHLAGLRLEPVRVGDIGRSTPWAAALDGVDVVIHLAARAHILRDKCDDPLSAFREVNAIGTARLAEAARLSGVRRFVFLSSIKVNGESTLPGRPFTPDDRPKPEGGYAISKFEAEQSLLQTGANSAMDVVIVRPPLVYGPGVKANFASMVHWLRKGLPLPLAAVRDNARSLVSVGNLVDFLELCTTHPAASGRLLFVSDGEDLSTAELLSRLGRALGRPARLFFVPLPLLKLAASLAGQADVYQRLCGSLQVDIRSTSVLLGWTPPQSVDEGLRIAVGGLRA